jgi:molybdate/tungstate transport system permease protein
MARVLGASPWYVFWQVLLPLISRNILTGCILMWARGVSEFGAVIILAYHPMTAPVLLYERFASFGLTYAKPTTVILILICLVIFIVLRILTEKHRLTKP